MPLTIPTELKKITPYVRRAEELDKDKSRPESRLVAYYCRQYAVHTGIPLATTPAGKSTLGELLGQLEQEKVAMDSFTRDEAKYLCRAFADQVFNKADQEDQSGNATKFTAKTFYAAASFLEILQQFYQDNDVSDDHNEEKKRIVYAKWKATDILKAIREGRTPTPGGYGQQQQDEEDNEEQKDGNNEGETGIEPPSMNGIQPPNVETVIDDTSEEEVTTIRPPPPSSPPTTQQEQDDDEESDQGTEVQLGPPPAYPNTQDEIMPPPPSIAPPTVVDRPPMQFNPAPPVLPPVIPPSLPAVPTSKPEPPPAKTTKKTGGGFFGLGGKKKKNSKAELADATELTKFALAALEDKNGDLAAKRLQQALQALGR